MTLPGVGKKTADVVLLFNAGKQVIPVDRHIARISKRLELVPSNAHYDTIRLTLEEAIPPQRTILTLTSNSSNSAETPAGPKTQNALHAP